MKIGFIGLGIMGSRMAANLQGAGHVLVVHNRTREKAEALLDGGGIWASTPAELAGQVELVITMLAHPQAVRDAVLGEEGILAGLPAGALWIDCSTVNPSFSRDMAAAAARHEVRFVDAPVAGSKNQAAEAQLVFFAGGDDADLQRCRPLFDVMGRATIHVGDQGKGTSLKMVINMMLAVSMTAFAEGVALGESLGIDRQTLFDVLIGGPVVAPFLGAKRAKMEAGDYEPEFPLQWMHKDLHLAATTAYESGTTAMLASLAREIYGQAQRAGFGDDDFSAVFEFLTASVPSDGA